MAQPFRRGVIALALWAAWPASAPVSRAGEEEELPPIPAIPRRIPPPGGEPATAVRESLEARMGELRERVGEIAFEPHAADAGVLVKAVEFALRHGEFYRETTADGARAMLDLAARRHRAIAERGAHPWTERRGRVVRGYRSRIDDSYQPFGVEIPEGLDLSEPVPLLVWLHGRDDQRTDLPFLEWCRTGSRAFGGMVAEQEDCIILYPFGRHAVGWAHAGEIDVLEVIEKVKADYPVDPDRIALAGFSTGGAGARRIGAHYRDRFCAVHASDFAGTLESDRVAAQDHPPERRWTAGRRYDRASVDATWARLCEAWERGRAQRPTTIRWQTSTLRYPGSDWLQLRGLEAHGRTALAEAEWDAGDGRFDLALENVSAVEIAPGPGTDLAGSRVAVGETALEVGDPGFPVEALALVKRGGKWRWGEPGTSRKRPGVQGPIDDAFRSRFVVVPPGSRPASPRVVRWLDFERDHFRDRWSARMRGNCIQKLASHLDSDDIAAANLVLWGDPGSNAMIAEIVDRLPIEWDDESFTFRGHTLDADRHVPVFIHPNPLNPDRYVVVNSGPTFFREGHDRTNSQQNPMRFDWAIVGLEQLPDETSPGRVVDAGSFDESWQ